MRKTALIAVLVAALPLAGCLAGPKQFYATVDDWDQQLYVDSPWFNGAMWLIPVVPAGRVGALIGDALIGNFYTFWFRDAFGGEGGTTVRYADIETKRSMKSLLRGDGRWAEVSADG